MLNQQFWIDRCLELPHCAATRAAFADWLLDETGYELTSGRLRLLSRLLQHDWAAEKKEWSRLPMTEFGMFNDYGSVPTFAFCLLARFTRRGKLPLFTHTLKKQSEIVMLELATCGIGDHSSSVNYFRMIELVEFFYRTTAKITPRLSRHKRNNRLAVFWRDYCGCKTVVAKLASLA